MSAKVSAKKAVELFRKNKELAAPAIISATFTVAFIVGFFILSGAYSVMQELIMHEQIWQQSQLPIDFDEYLLIYGMDALEAVIGLFTWNNFWLLIGLFGIKTLFTLYFGSMSWAMIARAHNHSKKSVWELTHQFFVRYSFLHIIIILILYLPVALFVFGGLYVLVTAGNAFLAAGAVAIAGILLFVYLVGAFLRLIFTAPSLYDKNQGVTKTLTHAYHVTGHHFQHVLVVTLIALALLAAAVYIGQNPSAHAASTALFSMHIISVILAGLAVGVFVIIEGVIVTYERIFLYEAYHEHIRLK